MAKESFFKPFYSVLVLAFVCSFLVSLASVGLRPLQESNRALERKKNILLAAGLLHGDTKDKDIDTLFAQVEPRIIDLATGAYVSPKDIDPKTFNQSASTNDPQLSRPLPKDKDIAGLRRLEKYSMVYLVKDKGKLKQIVLPVRGKGLWSTMYGYVALDSDLRTIDGIAFYEHGETPGLGGEIENPAWEAGWQGKKLYDDQGRVALKVAKGASKAKGEAASYEVDGLSGATLTGNGVQRLFHFWFSGQGFKPFLERLRSEEGKNG
ncbi:MAG TPA: Na(+)-translocating NADH-quinone reductase subunit C [Desulfobulbaceae bacterium]|nr:Na(+)-translocating NADH-quinone reductase subunit C [Desulfobulbaceae bacterium]